MADLSLDLKDFLEFIEVRRERLRAEILKAVNRPDET